MEIDDVNTPAERALLEQGFLPRTALVWGSAARPGAMWESQQNMALQSSLLNPERRSGHSLRTNRPVPRQAACHYISLDNDRNNHYFY